ncbi:hypothetical protein GC175_33765 [bacterium]|nr:hypothetical protein [bacterium]
MTVERVVRKYRVGEQPSEYSYWQTQSPEARIAALEQIRKQYNNWKHDARPGFQRVYRIVKR